MNALAALQPFATSWAPVAPEGERCGLCARAVETDQHEHLVELDRRSLICACPGCVAAIAQPRPGLIDHGYRRIPSRVLFDPAFRPADAQWASLKIPVGLSFLFFNSRLARWIGLYPSPAGAVETELDPAAVADLGASTPLVAAAVPDVEAILAFQPRGAAPETFLAPIDACYRLVGRVRLHWEGFQGGDRAWQEIEAVFAELRARARPLTDEVAP